MGKDYTHMLRLKRGTFERFNKIKKDYAGPLGNLPTVDQLLNALMEIYEERKALERPEIRGP